MKKLTGIKGFSLAEIVVTLMIIGVIASMTMPSLVGNVNRKEYAARLQSSYSTINQAIAKMELDNGPVGKNMYWTDPEQFWPLFAEQFNTLKVCGLNEAGCFTDTKLRFLNGEESSNYDGNGYSLRTTNGLSYNYNIESSPETRGLSDEDKLNIIGRILVDLNSEKGPNKYGEDIFIFCLVKGKGFVPSGTFDNSKCARAENGLTCASKVLQEGKIDY